MENNCVVVCYKSTFNWAKYQDILDVCENVGNNKNTTSTLKMDSAALDESHSVSQWTCTSSTPVVSSRKTQESLRKLKSPHTIIFEYLEQDLWRNRLKFFDPFTVHFLWRLVAAAYYFKFDFEVSSTPLLLLRSRWVPKLTLQEVDLII